ncbi:MAG: hypothetical protein Kow0063_43370 [Anaerolineae bacterium]
MDLIYAVPGLVAALEWLLAAILCACGWQRARPDLNRLGDSLGVAGLVTALGGAMWLVWDGPLSLSVMRSSLATGLAVSAWLIHRLLARQRMEGLSSAGISGFALLIQLLAVGQLLFAGEPPPTTLPLGPGSGILSGLPGYGGLAVGGVAILLRFGLDRMRDHLADDQSKVAEDLWALEWKSWQVALVALSLSLSISLVQTWWRAGQITQSGIRQALTSWLLLAAGVYGLNTGTTPRLARALLALAGVIGVISVLTMGGYPAAAAP